MNFLWEAAKTKKKKTLKFVKKPRKKNRTPTRDTREKKKLEKNWKPKLQNINRLKMRGRCWRGRCLHNRFRRELETFWICSSRDYTTAQLNAHLRNYTHSFYVSRCHLQKKLENSVSAFCKNVPLKNSPHNHRIFLHRCGWRVLANFWAFHFFRLVFFVFEFTIFCIIRLEF